ncbi:MAG: hypothetical protein H0X46_00575 [Bacteroidetes bacterium]|nr:hypothetical protein [Bacteroidota bacterium]
MQHPIRYILIFAITSNLFSFDVFAQKDNLNSDCKSAIQINIFKKIKYTSSYPSHGFGSIQEISTARSKFIFEKEHNSSWYLLNVQKSGELFFDIIPLDSTNDYDFLLYKIQDSSFCKNFVLNELIPVRANLAKNAKNSKGLTGLFSNAKQDYCQKGPGDSYSKSIQVEKGSTYMLILDNITKNGKGHTICFDYTKSIKLSGFVKSSVKHNLSAEIILIDKDKSIIGKTFSDKKTGFYDFSASIKENSFYSLVFLKNGYFPESNYINTKLIDSTNNYEFTIDKELDSLIVGKSHVLTHYSKNQQDLSLYEEWPPLYALAILLERDPKIIVTIQVHADDEEIKEWETHKWISLEDWDQVEAVWKTGIKANVKGKPSISEWRARNLVVSLRKKGVLFDRIKVLPTNQQIILKPKTESEHKENRQISITIN